MKIAVLAHLEHPIALPYAGGLEKHTKVLCDQLSARGHEVVLYGDPRSRIEGEIAEICEKFECFNYSHLRHHSLEFYHSYLSKHYTYMEFMQDIMHDSTIDLIHNNSLHYVPVSFSRLLKIPIVSVLHTPPLKELRLAYDQEKNKTNPLHRIVCVSAYLQRAWQESVPQSQVIHNGVSILPFLPTRSSNKHAFWSGRIVPEKGLEDSIKACRAKNISLRFAGPIADEGYYREVVAPYLNESIQYLGHLDDQRLFEEISQASVVLITPKWNEPFGLVAIEALSRGTPVVAYARGGLTEIIDEKVGVLVAPDNYMEVAEAMAWAAQLSPVDCWMRARNFFSIESMINKYEQIYNEIKTHEENRLLHSPRGEWSYSKGLGSSTFHEKL